MIYLVFFGIHIVFCLILAALWTMKRIAFHPVWLWIVLFVPIWGTVMLWWQKKSDADEEREKEFLEIRMGERDFDQDERFQGVSKSIQVDQDDMREKVVPIEEALVVNDTATRRELIVDVLYTNPNDYISQLYKAKANSDTEVVHYAATALAEIQKEFDLAFQDIAMRKSAHPMDESIDQEYRRMLEKYIDSGLLEGDGLKNQQRIYSELLGRDIEKENTRGLWGLLNKKAETDLALEDEKALDQDIAMMEERWPERDGVYKFKLKRAMLQKDRKKIEELLRQMEENNIFLSAELRNMIRFWES
ncbi:MAG: hypothetical protein K6E18_04245 [Lachnospiraceae bacterium]|nr:hypothetical protein [Lachnospiraceae bacterium]